MSGKKQIAVALAGVLASAVAAYWFGNGDTVTAVGGSGTDAGPSATEAFRIQASAAQVSPTYAPAPPSSAWGSTADEMLIGDVTGDGLDDVVVASGGTGDSSQNLYVVAQRADGRLSAPVAYSYGANAPAWGLGLALGDLNNDAIADIVVGRSGGMTFFIADGLGGFRTVKHESGYDAQDVGILDIDLDGNLDVVGRTLQSGSVQYLGDGNGGIRTSRFWTAGGLGMSDLKVGDVTGDALQDVVISPVSGSSSVTVYAHDRGDGFAPGRAYSANLGAPGGLAIGDFNNDGRNDVAVTETVNSPTRIWLLNQNESGLLEKVNPLTTLSTPSPIIASDLDRDGRQDLVVLHGSEGQIGYYLQGESGLGAELLVPIAPNARRMAAGDLNGDGCTDLAVANYVSDLTVLAGTDCVAPAPGRVAQDVDGDRNSDLLWRNSPATHWAFWTMNGAQRKGGESYAVGPDWRIVATGDFQGDGRLDLIWTNGYAMQMWQGDGVGYGGVAMQAYPAGWRIVGVGDADADGKDDLVWRNDGNTDLALWKMDGASIAGSRGFSLAPQWHVIGSGDFDGDRRMDLVLTDNTIMRLWSGASRLLFSSAAMGGYPAGWELAGIGDVDGDRRSDMFWRHATGGYFVHWKMVGPRRVAGTTYHVDGSWRVVANGDYNGDGRGDVVWTNGSAMQLWAATGQTFLGQAMPSYPQSWAPVR